MSEARRPLPVLLPAALALGAAALAWWGSVGDVGDYFRYQMPPGQALYVFAKLAGLAAGTLLTVQIVLVLLRDAPSFKSRFSWGTGLHATLGVLTVCVLIAHVALFVAASSVRTGTPALELLLPIFGRDPYRTGLALGSVSLILLVAVVPCGPLIRRAAGLKRVHRFTIAALALAIVHALVVGSEKSSIIALAVCASAVCAALAWRWMRGRRTGEHASAQDAGQA